MYVRSIIWLFRVASFKKNWLLCPNEQDRCKIFLLEGEYTKRLAYARYSRAILYPGNSKTSGERFLAIIVCILIVA